MNCKSRGWFLGDLELNRRSRGNTGSHVATSQCRNAWSTEESQQENQRRDVSTSRRLNVATLQRRDLSIIKSNGRSNFGRGEERED